MKPALAAITLVLSLVAAVAAGPLEDAEDAIDRSDYATALRLWRPLANQGVARAQYFLGVMYDRGQGVPQDYAEALKWYRLAADQGVVSAQTTLGIMYRTGRGVPQDYAEALNGFASLLTRATIAQTRPGGMLPMVVERRRTTPRP
jgi:TPR repeat protein